MIQAELGTVAIREAFLGYEIANSWVARFVWWKWGQDFLSSYFAQKTNKKYERYLKFLRRKRMDTQPSGHRLTREYE